MICTQSRLDGQIHRTGSASGPHRPPAGEISFQTYPLDFFKAVFRGVPGAGEVCHRDTDVLGGPRSLG